jgi:tetratricopeptide (TPR) repeat protein
MTLKNKILGLLDTANQKQLAFTESLSGADRETSGTPEQWAAKDTLAHMAAWTQHLADNLSGLIQAPEPLDGEETDQANAEIFEDHRHKNWNEILELLKTAYHSLKKEVEALPEEKFQSTNVLTWQEDRPLWRLIVNSGYTHPLLHIVGHYTKLGETVRATALQEEMTNQLSELDDSPEWKGTLTYNLACQYSLIGQKQDAVRALRMALELNPGLLNWSKQDPDLDALRDDLAYQAIYAK